MKVIELADGETARRWDECVQGAPEATVYQLAGWKRVMERTFGHKAHYLMVMEGGDALGVLPLLHIKSSLAGHYVTSPSGGICCRDEQAATALLERAKELVTKTKAKYLILRDSRHRWDLPGLVTSEDHCTFVGKLCPAPSQLWSQLDRRVRQQRPGCRTRGRPG